MVDLKKGARLERTVSLNSSQGPSIRTTGPNCVCVQVPADRFHSVCEELRQALNREQEAQALIQQQTDQVHTLQHRVEEAVAHDALGRTTQVGRTAASPGPSRGFVTPRGGSVCFQALSEARRELSRKERSLRILGKHLSTAQNQKQQLEEKLQQTEDELRDASR